MMQAVHFRPGGPENLYLADVPLPELWSKHVHLRVIGTAINRADLLQRKGLYPPPQGTTNILGLEATGRRWAKGDLLSFLRGIHLDNWIFRYGVVKKKLTIKVKKKCT